MFIISLKKPGTEELYLLQWDLSKNKPAEGAVLLPPPAFKEWVAENHPHSVAILDKCLANVADHGTSHDNRIVTPARWLARSSYKPEANTPARHYTVEDLFNLYHEEPEALNAGEDALEIAGEVEGNETEKEEEPVLENTPKKKSTSRKKKTS